MSATIQFEPLVPPALWLALAVAVGLAVALYAARRPAVISRRRWGAALSLTTGGLVLVLLILLNPIVATPLAPPEGKPRLTILVDRSASMAVADAAGGKSRFQAAAATAVRLARDLAGTFDVQLRTFADQTAAVSGEQLLAEQPAGQVTDLATAVTESLDNSRDSGQAIVVLSDGIHNAAGASDRVLEAGQAAHARSVPVFTSPIGGATVRDDLELSLVRQQELAFVGQRTPVRVMIKQRGRLVADAEVELLDDKGETVEKQQAALATDPAAADATAQTVFQVSQTEPGLYRYQIRLPRLKSEATGDNNSSTFVLRTIDRPIRVLLLEGKPYWDSKFLMRTLAQDQALDLDAVIRMADGRFLERKLHSPPKTAEGEPARREQTSEILRELAAALFASDKLAEFQIIILGRDAEAFLDDGVLERLRTWISREGGSLVCFRGAPVARLSQQLARLMPVRWSPAAEARFHVQLTSRGQDLSWISAAPGEAAYARLPSLATAAPPGQPTPLAVVLAESAGQSRPVVSYQPYGSGRVVAIEGAGMWRWAFLAPQHQEAEPLYNSLWQGLTRWLVAGGRLAPGQQMSLRTDKVSFFSEEPVSATLLVREEQAASEVPRVELREAGGRKIVSFPPAAVGDDPGVYRVLFGALPVGTYEASVGDRADDAECKIVFDVRPNFSEQLDTAARPDLLAALAERSGGSLLAEPTASEISRRFKEHLARQRPPQVEETTIWDRWWALALVVGLWSAAWGLRRQRGLI
jgi:hypothetical protein